MLKYYNMYIYLTHSNTFRPHVFIRDSRRQKAVFKQTEANVPNV